MAPDLSVLALACDVTSSANLASALEQIDDAFAGISVGAVFAREHTPKNARAPEDQARCRRDAGSGRCAEDQLDADGARRIGERPRGGRREGGRGCAAARVGCGIGVRTYIS